MRGAPLFCFAAICAAAAVPADPSPQRVIPSKLADLRARDAGVDRLGNLWAWQDDEVKVYTPGGEVVAVLPVRSGASAVDADREWGLLSLDAHGRNVLWARPGQEAKTLALTNEVADVAWVGRDELAVSPTRTGHRVEIWNLTLGARAATWGDEAPFAPPGPGAYLLRTVLLEHDDEHDRLWALESFTGDLQVFSETGERIARAQIPNPKREQIEEWRRGVDADARRTGRVNASRYRVLRLALDEQGEGWVVEGCSADKREAALAKIRVGGDLGSPRAVLEAPCCSRLFTVWQGGLLFYASPDLPGEQCTTVRRVP